MSAELRHLPVSVSIWNRLRSELAEAHGLDEGDEVLADSLDGIAELGDQMHELLRLAIEKELFADALGRQIERLKGRRERLASTATTIRQHVAEAAHDAGMKRLDRPDMTVSFRISPPSLVGSADPATMPSEFVRVKLEVNKPAVREALASGETVLGFTLSNGRPTLSVRQS